MWLPTMHLSFMKQPICAIELFAIFCLNKIILLFNNNKLLLKNYNFRKHSQAFSWQLRVCTSLCYRKFILQTFVILLKTVCRGNHEIMKNRAVNNFQFFTLRTQESSLSIPFCLYDLFSNSYKMPIVIDMHYLKSQMTMISAVNLL